MKIANICYIVNKKGKVLLQHKSRGFGKGKWNGPGGKVEPNETIEESVKREVLEETGLRIKDMEKRAVLEYLFKNNESWNMECHIFVCSDYEGKEEDKGEGELKWFEKDGLPLQEMWDDDKFWLKDVLDGSKRRMRFLFDEKNNLISYKNLKQN